MIHYRIKVRDEKAPFFEELLRYLDFLDYEKVEGFSEPRIYANFELKSKADSNKGKPVEVPRGIKNSGGNSADNLREVLSRIDKLRESIHK